MAQLLRSRFLIAASVLVAASFLLDLFTPLGFAGGVPYALAVLVAGAGSRPRDVFAVAIAGALLTVLGFFVSPAGSPTEVVLSNRGLALLLILGAMIFVLHVHRGAIERERNRFFEESLDLLLIGGLDGYLRRANPALVELLEYPQDRLLEIPYLDHVHPDDREETAAAIGSVARGEDVPSFRHRLITRGGAIRWIEWTAPAVLPCGGVFYAAGRDITERIEQEEQLHLAREFLGSAIDSLSSHICILDESGKIVLINQKWRQFAIENGDDETGYLGIDYFQASCPPDAKDDQTACDIASGIKEVLSGRRAKFQAEYACHSPNEKRWFSCRVTSFVNAGRRWATVAHENVTQRHLAEERQARYAEVIESTSDFVGVARADGRSRFINHAGRRMIGIAAEEDVTKLKVADLHPDSAMELLESEALPAAVRDGTWSGELTFLTRDGHEIPTWTVLVAHRGETGAVEYFSAVSRDTRERNRADRNNRMLAAIVRSSSDAIIGKTLGGIVTSWNRAAETIYGYSADEMIGEPLWRIVPEDRRHEVDEILGRIRQGQSVSNYETVRRTKDGELKTVSLSISPVLNHRHQVTGASVVARDISEKQSFERRIVEQERRLRDAQQRLRLVLDSTAEAIYGSDLDGTCTFANAACVRMLGYGDECELLGRNMNDVVRRSRADGSEDPDNGGSASLIVRGERTHVDDEILWRRDGTSFPVEYWSHPVTENGTVVGSVVTFLDITDRRSAEEELRLKEEKLKHAQRMEAVGALAGGIAHEFNNLLQVINGYGSFALDGLDPNDPRGADIEQVLHAAQRAATLTDQLLSFSRRQVMCYETVDLRDLTKGLVSMLRPLLGERINLETRLCGEPTPVQCDSSQLHQVLMNLCVNARDAMPDGGNLRIEVERVAGFTAEGEDAGDGELAVVTVADSGEGMTNETRERIFEPFFTTKEVGQGTGLGLAMVYGVVSEMGGTIDVESEPGVGTTFRMQLPLAAPEPQPVETRVSLPRPNSNTTILVAEDEPLVRYFLERVLKQAGYEVLVVANGDEAIQTFQNRRRPIHLLLLDVVMPGLNGIEVVERIREQCPDIPVVFCTGYAPNSREVSAIIKEGMPVIRKPVDREELIATVLEASRPAQATEEVWA